MDNRRFMFKNMHHGMAGRKGFRAQSGVGASSNFYDLGREAAEAAFVSGGVQGLLAFLAGFNASSYQ